MNKKNIFLSFTLAFSFLFISITVLANHQNLENSLKNDKRKSHKKENKKVDVNTIEWLSIEEALERNEKEPRLILIDLYTDWCGWCKRMDQTTFKNEDVAKYLGKKYYAVKMDGEFKKPIKVGDQTFKFVDEGRRGYHELAAALMNGQMSYPTIVILGSDLSKLTIAPGYKDPPMMDKILKYFGEGHNKTTAWTVFDKTYRSRVKK